MNRIPESELIGRATRSSRYVVIKNDKVIRKGLAVGANEAITLLNPKGTETLFIKVRGGK